MESHRPEDPLVPAQSPVEEEVAGAEEEARSDGIPETASAIESEPAQPAEDPVTNVEDSAQEVEVDLSQEKKQTEPITEDAELDHNEAPQATHESKDAHTEHTEEGREQEIVQGEDDQQELEPELSDAEQEEPAAEEQPLVRPWLKYYPDEVPATLTYPDCSIAEFLSDAAKRFPDHDAVYFMGKRVTYREVHVSAIRLAKELTVRGVAKGDRVAIMLPNCPQAVIAYYAVLFAGAVVVQTNPLYVERELEHQLKDSGASAIITLDLLYDRLSRVRGEIPEEGPIPELRHIIVTSLKDGLPFPKSMLYPIKQRKEGFRSNIPYGKEGVIAYRSLLKGTGPNVSLPELGKGDELAALQYTGGTTGTPKGVMLTHANFVANSLQTSAWCYKAEDGKERFLAALPLFHVFGLTVAMNMSVLKAGTLILLPRFETETVLKTIAERKPTIFPGAPTMYVALINHPNASKFDLSSINVCISGSAALPLEVQEQFEALSDGRLIEGYGLTEATPVTHANPIWGHRKIGTIGVPFPDTDAAIMDPVSGKLLPSGELGELIIRGPQVMKGYWSRPKDTKDALRNGWLRTGDLATMDEDGYFTIMDRIKDVIIASGFNIYPREVEEVLFEHPAVREAAVLGVKDEYRGETVKAYIVLKEGWQVSRSQLDRWCRERLAAFKVPQYYAFRETLPKTMVGKVLRRKLAEEDMESTNVLGDDKE
ncbi:long-chain-fatty-acid--CoA ligase [Paenibacillus paeoniae]|uniref:Long-chain fatty acid--CoA ligase n=1 Tax=Paenibacillus paeoniae TaxID=2292705 RepID=A0A371PEQ0_9BACL|nr:long-chain fatty acid--CoA ligase [Paenibacillus paeoniae]REK74423.1 long-chain fatty acid--CoA ligase [Paenibacillus paeoniae]